MNHFHAVCWIDHHEARVFHFDAHDFERATIRSDKPNGHIHNKRAPEASHGDKPFHEAVAAALTDAQEILLLGPGQAKAELAAYLKAHNAALAKRIVATENADHPTDGEIVGRARKHFKKIDRMTPQLG